MTSPHVLPATAPHSGDRELLWSARQLAEFVATLSDQTDERSTIDVALQHIAEGLDVEVAAYLQRDQVIDAIGFAGGRWDVDALLRASGDRTLSVPGIGRCETVVVALEPELGTRLVLGRAGDPFDWSEQAHLRSVARVLVLALRSTRLIRTMHEQQAILKRLSLIQRSISTRVPVAEVFQSIVSGASDLLDGTVATLTLVDQVDPQWSAVVATTVPLAGRPDRPSLLPTTHGLHGRTIANGEPLRVDRVSCDRGLDGVLVGLACPVRNAGEIVGTLIIGSLDATREYAPHEEEAMVAFAEHASLALTDARTLVAMHEAFHDAVTGLPNRSLLLDHLDRAFESFKSHPSGPGFSILFCDLDRFKAVNDRLGHHAGDQLLRIVGQRIKSKLRGPSDIVARLGGDEFAVIVHDCDDTMLARLAERIIGAVSEPVALDGKEAFVGVSIGIAHADASLRVGDLLRNADAAMYQAKSSGRNRWSLYEPGMLLRALAKLELESDLHLALRRDQLFLHYQPIVSLQSGRLVGAEALLRWQHPTAGVVSPLDFIPIAEENGLIVPIGLWTLRKACEQLMTWQRDHEAFQGFTMNVNVSGRQLVEPTFVDDVRRVLEQTGVRPDDLCIEITETVLLHDETDMAETLDRLKALGIRLAIDDFGTGYSSISYLRRFTIDSVKVDKSFIDSIDADSDHGVLARTVVGIGQSLNLDVVAEGIESPNQVARLQALACERGQGFHFARPLTAAALEQFLLESGVDSGLPRTSP